MDVLCFLERVARSWPADGPPDDVALKVAEPSALSRCARLWPRLFGLIDEALLLGSRTSGAGDRKIGPERTHSGNAPMPVTSWVASRTAVTTMSPPKPVVAR
jgi:hypothetical protein